MKVVRPWQRLRRASWILCSVSVSTALVASSRSTIDGRFRMARAMAIRCNSPPESLMPRSPTRVSYPRRLVSPSSLFHRVGWVGGTIHTVSKRLNLFVDARRATGLVYFLVRRREPRVSDIVDDGVIEENWRLGHDANMGTKAAAEWLVFGMFLLSRVGWEWLLTCICQRPGYLAHQS